MPKYSKKMLKAVELQMAMYDEWVAGSLPTIGEYEGRVCHFCIAAGGTSDTDPDCGVCLLARGADNCMAQVEWDEANDYVWVCHLRPEDMLEAIRIKQQVLIDMIGENGYDVVEVDA